ncbi:hypothetical protein G4B88_019712 [Cannabis sativa]|uniref:Uncharacterized protein n=1 Tax=Cannabis sativa TaxID=3483 RepID=A0A7J6HT00_CANSA|nr:hypothetical protein G4B88_019712 [Cannabis sativa]
MGADPVLQTKPHPGLGWDPSKAQTSLTTFQNKKHIYSLKSAIDSTYILKSPCTTLSPHYQRLQNVNVIECSVDEMILKLLLDLHNKHSFILIDEELKIGRSEQSEETEIHGGLKHTEVGENHSASIARTHGGRDCTEETWLNEINC